ncbi:MAG: mobile mystery protein B [Bacteroidales bacterium]|nr:mobile mystery protein B [Bacteroidales bacterium]MBN2756744.1 mobile mystery protein B [Bacteroidales bacterium]
MGLELEYTETQTSLDDEEKEGLLIRTITTRYELDEFEQQNIEKAIEWSMLKKFTVEEILSEAFVKRLHKKMFDQTWRWAGEFRKTNKNIGVDKFRIGIELRHLFDDCQFWIKNKVFSEDEIAIRFKHRMVNIHPFPNGNGRHSRLIADILIEKGFEKPIFSWGGNILSSKSKSRSNYLKALFAADLGDFTALIQFARN